MSIYTLNNVNYSYVVNSGIASVSRSASASGNVIILDKFTVLGVEYTVTSILQYAFQSTNITGVTIPPTITTIGNQVFEVATKLTSLTIPSTVTSVGNNIVSGCTLLLTIIIKSNLANIKNALGNINRAGLSITFDYSGAILDGMCYNAENLSNVIIGKNITSIGAEAFRFCAFLTSIIIPSSVTSIGANAFNGTTRLLNVYFLGNNIPTIGASNFTAANDIAYYIQGAANISRLSVFTSSNSVTSSQMNTLVGYVHPAPVITSITSGNRRAFINFTQSAPSSEEVLPAIQNYAYSIDGTNYIDLSPAQITSPLQIHELNNQIYSFTIKASNGSYSNASNSVSILVSPPQYYPGDLDPEFGINGKSETDLLSREDRAYAMAVQSDNKIVLGGLTNDGMGLNFAAVRYNRDGSLDTLFGNNGIFVSDVAGRSDSCMSIGFQSDGKIILGGWATIFPSNADGFALMRLNTNGTLDNTFGSNNNGKVITTDMGLTRGYSMKIQADNKIILGGYGVTVNNDFALARYNSNGSLDNTFGNQGIVLTDFSNNHDTIFAIEIQPDGKIIATGTTTFNSRENIGLARYNSDGSLDNTFGTGGKVTTQLAISTYANSVAVDGNNKIVIGGTSGDAFVLARYNSNGSIDNTFGINGIVTTVIGNSNNGNSILILDNGKIFLGGKTRMTGDIISENFALLCFNSDGTLDNTFGKGGKVHTDFNGNTDIGYAVALQRISSNNYILLAGMSSKTSLNFALARYLTLPIVKYPVCFPAGTPVETDQGPISIEKIKLNIHTINNKKIVAITKTVTCENKIVCIEKDSLGKNIPSQKTYISRNHKILYNNKMIKAKHLVKNIENVYFKDYTDETLYNVLLDTCDTMVVNNLIVETLDPDNIVAQLYNRELSENDKNTIIISINKLTDNYKKVKGKML